MDYQEEKVLMRINSYYSVYFPACKNDSSYQSLEEYIGVTAVNDPKNAIKFLEDLRGYGYIVQTDTHAGFILTPEGKKQIKLIEEKTPKSDKFSYEK